MAAFMNCVLAFPSLIKSGVTPIHLLKAKNDEYHQRFMTLREKGVLEGEGLTYNLDIAQSFVILTALPQEWNKETKHMCICRSFFKH